MAVDLLPVGETGQKAPKFPRLGGVLSEIRAIRDAQGRSVRKAAEAVGISHSTLSKYEGGTRGPTAAQLLWVSKAYAVPIALLYELIEAELAGVSEEAWSELSRHTLDVVKGGASLAETGALQNDDPSPSRVLLEQTARDMQAACDFIDQASRVAGQALARLKGDAAEDGTS